MITLIAKTEFLGIPEGFEPRSDQMVGTDAEQLIEFAGRICYNSMGKGRDSFAFSNNLLTSGHGSVLEHAVFSFFVTGYSRSMLLELERHRVGVALSVRSTRYCDESDSQVSKHPVYFMGDMELHDKQEKYFESGKQLYQETYQAYYKRMYDMGVPSDLAMKQARGAARNLLPNGLLTEFVWTANLRAIRHVIEMRASDMADAEIRMFTNELYCIMQEEAPQYMRDFEIQEAVDKTFTFTATSRNRKI